MTTHLSRKRMVALRAAFESADWTVVAILEKFRISRERMRRLAKEGGWVRPVRTPRVKQVLAEAELDALGRAYEASEEPVEAMCARFGIASTTLYKRASQNRWVRQKRAYAKNTLTAPPSAHSSEQQQALAERLHDILGAQIRALALREDSGDGADTAPRQLEQLIKCLKTLHDLSVALGAAPNDRAADSRSADEIRIAIRLRLDQRLAAARTDGVSHAAGGAE